MIELSLKESKNSFVTTSLSSIWGGGDFLYAIVEYNKQNIYNGRQGQ